MALLFELTTWKPAEAAELTGVSTALQRQWRKHGMRTPLDDDKVAEKGFNIITLSWLYAARVLVDNGAGYKGITPLLNHMGPLIGGYALSKSIWDVDDDVGIEAAREFIHQQPISYIVAHATSRGSLFAFRNDPISIGHPQRAGPFKNIENIRRWLAESYEMEPYLDEVEFAEEYAENRKRDIQNALPPAVGATIIDMEAAARALVARINGPVMHIFDTETVLAKMAEENKQRWALVAEEERKWEAAKAALLERDPVNGPQILAEIEADYQASLARADKDIGEARAEREALQIDDPVAKPPRVAPKRRRK
jgi:hypothetical protein